jgi:chromate transporter
MSDSTKPTIIKTANSFLIIGASSFGGLGAVLTLINREVVQRRSWLTVTDITEALTYTKFLPGSTTVQVVAYLGWKLHGWVGALIATSAFLLPAFLMMLFLAASYSVLSPLAGVREALSGLTAAVVGLLVLTTWTLGRQNITGIGGIIVAIVVLITSICDKVNPALLIIPAGLLGILVEARKKP